MLYGSVASLSSPSSNNEAWLYGTSLSFASLLHLGHQGYVDKADDVILIIPTKYAGTAFSQEFLLFFLLFLSQMTLSIGAMLVIMLDST